MTTSKSKNPPDRAERRKMNEQKEAQAAKPYEHCKACEYCNGKCHVNDKFQRRPRAEGGLGLCIKIGGRGC